MPQTHLTHHFSVLVPWGTVFLSVSTPVCSHFEQGLSHSVPLQEQKRLPAFPQILSTLHPLQIHLNLILTLCYLYFKGGVACLPVAGHFLSVEGFPHMSLPRNVCVYVCVLEMCVCTCALCIMCLCVHVSMYVRMHACMCVCCVCMYVSMCVMYVCVLLCVHACGHVCYVCACMCVCVCVCACM